MCKHRNNDYEKDGDVDIDQTKKRLIPIKTSIKMLTTILNMVMTIVVIMRMTVNVSTTVELLLTLIIAGLIMIECCQLVSLLSGQPSTTMAPTAVPKRTPRIGMRCICTVAFKRGNFLLMRWVSSLVNSLAGKMHRLCYHCGLKGVSKSVQVPLNGTEAVIVLTLMILQ